MSGNVVLIAVAVALVALAVVFFVASMRSDRARVEEAVDEGSSTKLSPSPEAAAVEQSAELERASGAVEGRGDATPAVWMPPDEDAIGVSRRQFLNRAILTTFSLSLASFGAACLAFLWPTPKTEGFGAKIVAGSFSEIMAGIRTSREPFYVPDARSYIQAYPAEALPKAKSVSSYGAVLPGMEQGVVALYQKCVHLGCKVPWCKSSQWFECPCHGSKYNRVGEKKGGPAPRGLDRFPVTVSGGKIVIDTGTVIQGPVVGTDTTGQEAEGPNC